jgi:hypothetical protein
MTPSIGKLARVSRLSMKNIDGDEVAQNKLWDYYAMLRSSSFHSSIFGET